MSSLLHREWLMALNILFSLEEALFQISSVSRCLLRSFLKNHLSWEVFLEHLVLNSTGPRALLGYCLYFYPVLSFFFFQITFTTWHNVNVFTYCMPSPTEWKFHDSKNVFLQLWIHRTQKQSLAQSKCSITKIDKWLKKLWGMKITHKKLIQLLKNPFM